LPNHGQHVWQPSSWAGRPEHQYGLGEFYIVSINTVLLSHTNQHQAAAVVNPPNPAGFLVQYNNQNQLEACLVQLEPRRSHKTAFSGHRTLHREEAYLAQLSRPHSRKVTAYLAQRIRLRVVGFSDPLRPPLSLSRTTACSAEAFLEVKGLTISRLRLEGSLEVLPPNSRVGCLAKVASRRIQAYSGLQIPSKDRHSSKVVDCLGRQAKLRPSHIMAASLPIQWGKTSLIHCCERSSMTFYPKPPGRMADRPRSGSSIVQTQGQPQAQQQPQQQQAPSIFTNSIGQLSQQQQTVPGVRISVNELRPTTRFNDLHEELQRVIENIDNFILEQMKFQGQCEHAISGDDGVEKTFVPLPGEVQYAQTTLDAVQQALENDAQAIAHTRDLNKADQSDAKLSFRAVSTLRMPQQFQHSSLRQTASASHMAAPSLIDDDGDGAASNLVSYFSNQTNEMSNTMESFKGRLSEVEAYLNGMEVSMMDQMQQLVFLRGQDGGQKSVEDQVKELAAVLKEMQSGIGGVAGKLSGTREMVQEVVLGEDSNRIAARRARRY